MGFKEWPHWFLNLFHFFKQGIKLLQPSRVLWCLIQSLICSCSIPENWGQCWNIVNFVASKTRVTPANKRSIPICPVISKLINSVSVALETEVQLQEHICFINSKVALYWIKGATKEWKPFIEKKWMRSGSSCLLIVGDTVLASGHSIKRHYFCRVSKI